MLNCEVSLIQLKSGSKDGVLRAQICAMMANLNAFWEPLQKQFNNEKHWNWYKQQKLGSHREKRSRKLLERLVHTNWKDINKTWNGEGGVELGNKMENWDLNKV